MRSCNWVFFTIHSRLQKSDPCTECLNCCVHVQGAVCVVLRARVRVPLLCAHLWKEERGSSIFWDLAVTVLDKGSYSKPVLYNLYDGVGHSCSVPF